MQAAATPVLKDIVLIGGGHSHVGVLYMFAMKPMPGVRLTVICTDTDTPYSGMLPGYIAGHYSYDDVHIDLRRLAEFAGARYCRDEVIGIDRAQRKVLCRQRPPVAYDVLSINIGSTPQLNQVAGASEHAVPVKPIRRFNQRWLALLDRVCNHAGPTTIALVGAGAGGVEMTLAMQYRLRNELTRLGRDPDELQFHLFSASKQILPTHNASVRRAFEQVLSKRGVHLHCAAEVTQVAAGRLQTRAGEQFDADEVIWVTQAGGAAWLRDTGLALDEQGFIQIHDSLQTQTDALIFAAGDCAAMLDYPLEKAGVFAVRMAKPLTENLRRTLLRQPLLSYRPQRRWLALISTGDRHAVASRGAFYARGDLLWRWKDWIDRRFMRKFSQFPPMSPAQSASMAKAEISIPLDDSEHTQAISALAMRCGGCGAKVGASVLTRALASVEPIERDDVLIGLHAPDDAAVLSVPPGKALVHTVDFFRAFIDDPWLFGRIAANHALGDIFAMGDGRRSAIGHRHRHRAAGPGKQGRRHGISNDERRRFSAQSSRLCAGWRSYRRGPRVGVGLCGEWFGRPTLGKPDAQKRHASGRCADSDQTNRHRHLVRRPCPTQGARPLDRRSAGIHANLQSRRRAMLDRTWRQRLYRPHRLRPARPSAGNDPTLGGRCRT